LTFHASYANDYHVIGKAPLDYVRYEVIQSKEIVLSFEIFFLKKEPLSQTASD